MSFIFFILVFNLLFPFIYSDISNIDSTNLMDPKDDYATINDLSTNFKKIFHFFKKPNHHSNSFYNPWYNPAYHLPYSARYHLPYNSRYHLSHNPIYNLPYNSGYNLPYNEAYYRQYHPYYLNTPLQTQNYQKIYNPQPLKPTEENKQKEVIKKLVQPLKSTEENKQKEITTKDEKKQYDNEDNLIKIKHMPDFSKHIVPKLNQVKNNINNYLIILKIIEKQII